MRVHKDESRNLLFLLCFLMKTGAAMKNDATEIVYPHTMEDPGEEPADEAALNRARGGGRGSENAARDRTGECARLSTVRLLRTF
ncbi:sclerostin domain-containing protein 1a [Tachysurus ichikawai]